MYQISAFSLTPFALAVGLKRTGGEKRPRRPRRVKPSRSSAKEKDREGPVKTVRARGAYRRNARIDMKFGRVVVHDIRGLGTKLPPSPFLCLPVPSMRKRPGEKGRGDRGR